MKNLQMVELNANSLLTKGVQYVLESNTKYSVSSIALHDLTYLKDTLVILVLEKSESAELFSKINTLRNSEKKTQTPILVLACHNIEIHEIKMLMMYGHIGIVSIHSSIPQLYKNIELLLEEERRYVLSEEIQQRLLDSVFSFTETKTASAPELNNTEMKIVELAKMGYSLQQTATNLQLSKNTVAAYRSRILKKTHKKSMAQLLATFIL